MKRILIIACLYTGTLYSSEQIDLDRITKRYVTRIHRAPCARGLLKLTTLHILNQESANQHVMPEIASAVSSIMDRCPKDLDGQTRDAADLVTSEDHELARKCLSDEAWAPLSYVEHKNLQRGCHVVSARVKAGEALRERPLLTILKMTGTIPKTSKQ